MNTYHLALSGPSADCHIGGPRSLTLHARRNLDLLPCEIWQYLGHRQTTKARLYQHRHQILQWLNRQYHTSYRYLRID